MSASPLVLYPNEGHSFLGEGRPACRVDAAGRIIDWVCKAIATQAPRARKIRCMRESDLPKCRRVVLLVDFINPLDFIGSQQLTDPALAAAKATSAIVKAARAGGGR